MRSQSERFNEKWIGEPNSGCWLWTGTCDGRNYGVVTENGRRVKATHVSLRLHGRPVPPGMQACHKCDVTLCVNPQHLFIGTNADNINDMVMKGRSARGASKPHTKITQDIAREIIALAATGLPHKKIGKQFGITHRHVGKVARREIWAYVVIAPADGEPTTA